MTLFSKCDAFFQIWSIFTHFSMHLWPFFPNVTHCSLSNPLFQVWPTFPSVANFSLCYLFFQARPFFPLCFSCLTHLAKYRPFLLFLTLYDPFFSGVTHLSLCDTFCPIVTYFPLVDFFPSVTHFSKCYLFIQVWPIFSCEKSLTHYFRITSERCLLDKFSFITETINFM